MFTAVQPVLRQRMLEAMRRRKITRLEKKQNPGDIPRAPAGDDAVPRIPPHALYRYQRRCDVQSVFASGDVRSGSVKRVGAAIGERAVVGAELHEARADGAAELSGDAEGDSGTGSVGAIGMR
jgi:hypothetical protein